MKNSTEAYVKRPPSGGLCAEFQFELQHHAAKFWINSTRAGPWTRVDIKPEPMVYFRA